MLFNIYIPWVKLRFSMDPFALQTYINLGGFSFCVGHVLRQFGVHEWLSTYLELDDTDSIRGQHLLEWLVFLVAVLANLYMH